MPFQLIELYATNARRQEMLEFYCGELEFGIVDEGRKSDNPLWLVNSGQVLRIWFKDTPIRSKVTGLTFQVSDFSAALAHMSSLDCVVAGSISFAQRNFRIRDPCGNVIGIQRIPASDWVN